MKDSRSVWLVLLSFSVVLVLATACYRPAAPDVTPTPVEGEEAAAPGETDLEGTAIANSTRAAETVAAQTAEAEGPGNGEEEGEEEEETTELPTSTPAAPVETETPTSEVATPTPAVSPTEPAPTAVPEAPAEGSTTYTVQPGDTLFSLAVRYGTTVDAIVQANGLTSASQIYAGQQLTIPLGEQPAEQPSPPSTGGTEYVVQPGDRLFRIALRYDMGWTRLAEYNGITDPNSIYPGQVLQIPPQ